MSTKEATFRASDHSPRTHMAGKRVYLLACRNDNSFSVCALNRSGANKCGKNCVWRVCVRYQRASMCSIEKKNDEEKDVCLCLANGLTARQNLQQSMLWFCRFQIAPCNACIFIFFCAILASVRCLFLMTFFSFILFLTKKKKCCFSSLHFVWIGFRRFHSESHVCAAGTLMVASILTSKQPYFCGRAQQTKYEWWKKAHTRWAIALFVDDVRTTLFSGRTEIERKKKYRVHIKYKSMNKMQCAPICVNL